MSIKVDEGIPILPQPFPLMTMEAVFTSSEAITELDNEESLLLHEALETKFFSLTTASGQVDVPLFKQQRTLWCWAACAQMVLHSIGQKNLRQCRIARSLLPKDCCAQDCGKKCCNNDCSEEDVEAVYDEFGVAAKIHNGTISFGTLQTEISNRRRPVEVGIDWPGDNGGHLILVTGWSRKQEARRVSVNDPLYGEGEIRFSELTKYRGGRWVFTWTGFE